MSTAEPRTYLIRHGETDWSREGRHTGWTDIPLNQRGIAQAQALASVLQPRAFTAVFCSSLQRARQTCELAGCSGAAEILDDCREWNYGDYEGQIRAEIEAHRPGWNLWRDGVVNGESLQDVSTRADAVIARRLAFSGDVAIFAHGHFCRILAARWLGMDPDRGKNFALDTASISILGYEREFEVIARWNDVHHLSEVA